MRVSDFALSLVDGESERSFGNTCCNNALGHCSGDARSAAELGEEIGCAVAKGDWIIYMIHGVGEGTHGLFIDENEHQRLVEYLGGKQDEIWVAPLKEVAQYLKKCES